MQARLFTGRDVKFILVTICLAMSGIVATVACIRHQSDPKFSTFAHYDYEQSFLIEIVHRPSWDIAYSFVNDAQRSCKFGDYKEEKFKKQLEQSMTKIMSIWLSPLRNKKYIAADPKIFYKQLPLQEVVVNATDGDINSMLGYHNDRRIDEKHINSRIPAQYNLLILFRCSGKAGGGNTWFYMHDTLKMPIMVIQQGKHEQAGKFFLTAKKLFQSAVLLREIGHAFGLVNAQKSSTLNPKESVMQALKYAVGIRSLRLQKDDKDAVTWLYRYYLKRDIKRDECPDGYVHHEHSCIPHDHMK